MSWNINYRRAALVAATAAALGTTAVLAQPAPPPAPPAVTDGAVPQAGPGGGPPPWARQGMRDGQGHGHRHGMMQGHEMRGHEMRRGEGRMGEGRGGPFGGLVMPREDKALTGPEAVKIAEAFLLFRGERDWKIANPVETPAAVEFTLTTKDGSAIAKFSMDRKTGRVQRVS